MTAAAMAGRRRVRVLDACDVLAHEVAVIPAEFDARQPVQVVGIGTAFEVVFSLLTDAMKMPMTAKPAITAMRISMPVQRVFRLIELGQNAYR